MTIKDTEPTYINWKRCEPDQGEACCYNDVHPYKHCEFADEDCVSVSSYFIHTMF